MDQNLPNNPFSKVEVTVIAMDENFVILEILSIQEKIFWPRNKFEQNCKIGDHLMLELKPSNAAALNNLIENAKNESNGRQDSAKMCKLLEELIN